MCKYTYMHVYVITRNTKKKYIYLTSSYRNNMWCKSLPCIACINQLEVGAPHKFCKVYLTLTNQWKTNK